MVRVGVRPRVRVRVGVRARVRGRVRVRVRVRVSPEDALLLAEALQVFGAEAVALLRLG